MSDWFDPIGNELPAGPVRDAGTSAALRRHALHGGARASSVEDLVGCGCLLTLLQAMAGDRTSSADLSGLDHGPLAALDDLEGEAVPAGLPPVVDAHVHVFPDPVFDALWRWFETHAWPVRYKLRAPAVVRFLLERGVSSLFALHYAHKPGLSRAFNHYVAELAKAQPRVVGFATVMPGEPAVVSILQEAKDMGLRAVKLHCHVQGFAPDSPAALEVFGACEQLALPVLVHAGRQPRSAAYRVDPFTTCSVDRLAAVLRAHPDLKLCVPHFGVDEVESYGRLLEQHDNLFLDSTMMLSGFFPDPPPFHLIERWPGRILFGTDFPNLPYAWDRELRALSAARLPAEVMEATLSGAASAFVSA